MSPGKDPAAHHSQQTPATGFEIVEHTADWALRVYGANLGELFANAARGMAALMVPDLASVPADHERRVTLEAFDAETLLVDWLSELAYWAEDELLVFHDVTLEAISPSHLAAVVRGGRPAEFTKHIKAVTFHDLAIVETKSGLTATVVFDV
ncbi:MAG: archease [Chloroflexi bacterium]|nr:archease [Chloroflexota bacterium]MCI0648409.1 archease [Chloroflexota bacterium]MCI0727645.1 archease [Chloroflexota bacterium]